MDLDDADFASSSSKRHGSGFRSSLYRLDILKIELSSVYGVQVFITVSKLCFLFFSFFLECGNG